MKKVHIYCDGACSRNPGPGGWGAALIAMDSKQVIHTKHISGYCPETTNNRMEVQAAIEALRALKTACEVTVFSDSQYLVSTMSKGWSRNKNLDLWQELDDLVKGHSVRWTWVKGHDKNTGNNKVDKLATDAIKYRKGQEYYS